MNRHRATSLGIFLFTDKENKEADLLEIKEAEKYSLNVIIRIKQQIKSETQKRLDDFAFTREYRSIGSAAGYAGSHVSKFNSDGVYCKRAESDTWRILYSILEAVEDGTRDIPVGYEEIESELPVLAWPE